MSKRSPDFLRRARDLYPTPEVPVRALAPHLDDVNGFIEPCCGDGALIRHLRRLDHYCLLAMDLEPTGEAREYAKTKDALTLCREDWDPILTATHIITNPPWPAPREGGDPTIQLVWHLAGVLPTWLLLSADFAHNSYAGNVIRFCQKIVSVGRVRWIPDSPHVGYDNAAWYLFDRRRPGLPTFYPREPLWTLKSRSRPRSPS